MFNIEMTVAWKKENNQNHSSESHIDYQMDDNMQNPGNLLDIKSSTVIHKTH